MIIFFWIGPKPFATTEEQRLISIVYRMEEFLNLKTVVLRPNVVIGPILDNILKEIFLNPRKVVLCIQFRVCLSAHELLNTIFDIET